MARFRLRAAVVLAVVVTALLAGAAPAFAHTRLLSSDPTDGASLPTPPEQVALTFNENMQPAFSTLTVVGPDGTAYQSGPVTASGGTVSTAVLPLGPAGRYEIGYRVVSDDGHPVSGSVAFTLTTPGPAASSGVPVPPATSAVAPPSASTRRHRARRSVHRRGRCTRLAVDRRGDRARRRRGRRRAAPGPGVTSSTARLRSAGWTTAGWAGLAVGAAVLASALAGALSEVFSPAVMGMPG